MLSVASQLASTGTAPQSTIAITNVYGQPGATYAGSTYEMNGTGPPLGANMEKMPFPGECWVIADMSSQNQFQGPMGYGPNCGANQRVGTPHNGGCNVGFLDGHAKWMGQMDPLWAPCA